MHEDNNRIDFLISLEGMIEELDDIDANVSWQPVESKSKWWVLMCDLRRQCYYTHKEVFKEVYPEK